MIPVKGRSLGETYHFRKLQLMGIAPLRGCIR
jgi:hypothetical protein